MTEENGTIAAYTTYTQVTLAVYSLMCTTKIYHNLEATWSISYKRLNH